MAYPTSLDSFTSKLDGVDDVMAVDHNAQSVSIVAIETELGLNPRGTYTDVAARLEPMTTIGADIYRVATGSCDTASGTRTMVGYDSTRRLDAGFAVDYGTGAITVPTAGDYVVEGHARFSAAYAGGAAMLSVTDGTNELIRGAGWRSGTTGIYDLQLCGTTPSVAASAILYLRITTDTSTSLVGASVATGAYYYFRVARM